MVQFNAQGQYETNNQADIIEIFELLREKFTDSNLKFMCGKIWHKNDKYYLTCFVRKHSITIKFIKNLFRSIPCAIPPNWKLVYGNFTDLIAFMDDKVDSLYESLNNPGTYGILEQGQVLPDGNARLMEFELGERPPTDLGEFGRLSEQERWEALREAGKQGGSDAVAAIDSKTAIFYHQTFETLHAKHLATSSFQIFAETAPDSVDKEWQIDLEARLLEPPDDRKLFIYYDPVGGAGKTYFSRYMLKKYGQSKVQIYRTGNANDLAYMTQTMPTIRIIDLPRNAHQYVAWNFIECLKDNAVMSTKYASAMKYLPRCHVVIFTNEPIPPNTFSEDRLIIRQLSPSFIPPPAPAAPMVDNNQAHYPQDNDNVTESIL